MDELDSILSDEPIADVEAVTEVAAEPIVETQPRQADGKFAPKGETESASPAPVEEAPFDHAAVKGERERRQKAEQRARELEEELQALKQPAAPPVSMWEDETAWQQQFGKQVVSEAVNETAIMSKLQTSEMLMYQAHPNDFQEVQGQFLALMAENPSLQKQVIDNPHPWNKAYEIVQNHKRMTELSATSVSDLEAKLEAKIREELMAEMTQQPAAVVPQIPQSLADAQSSRTNAGASFRPPTLEEILGK